MQYYNYADFYVAPHSRQKLNVYLFGLSLIWLGVMSNYLRVISWPLEIFLDDDNGLLLLFYDENYFKCWKNIFNLYINRLLFTH